MPRKTGEDRNLRGDDATNAEVIAAVNANTTVVKDEVVSELKEVDVNMRRLVLGHEGHLWDADVPATEVEKE